MRCFTTTYFKLFFPLCGKTWHGYSETHAITSRDRCIVIRHSTWEFYELTTLNKQLTSSNVLVFFLLLFWNLFSDATDLHIIIVPENAEIYIWYLRKKVPPFWLQSHLFTKKVWFSVDWKKHPLSLNDSYICVIEFGFYYIMVPSFPVFPKII